jgi:hypothetical protein
MMQERRIPPQPGMPFKINHHFPDLNKMNVYLAGQSDGELQGSSLADGKLRVFLNSFDASVRPSHFHTSRVIYLVQLTY